MAGSNIGKVYTEIASDAQDYVDITPCNTKDCYRRAIKYSAPQAQLVALIDISEGCSQEFKVKQFVLQ